MSRGDVEWQRIVREALERGRTAESIGLRWDAAGWTLEESRYLARLSAWERRTLEQEIIDGLDGREAPRLRWAGAERWGEADFVWHVEMDIAENGTGGYRSVAKRIHGWSATALLRRWQKVSGGKPWPSPAKNRTTRTT